MQVTDKTSAQNRSDQIRAFHDELLILANEQVLQLDPVQQQKVNQHHQGLLEKFRQTFDTDSTQQQKQLTWSMRITSLIGALALAASIFFLLQKFWGHFGTVIQIGILISLSLGSFSATVIIANREVSGYFSKLTGFVALACFVINIFMLGEIFNITPSNLALLAFATLACLLAYAYRIVLLLPLAIIFLSFFIVTQISSWSGIYWAEYYRYPENFLPLTLLYFLPQWINQIHFPGFALFYRVIGITACIFPLYWIGYWEPDSASASYWPVDDQTVEFSYQVLSIFVSATFLVHGTLRCWSHVVNTSSVFFLLTLFSRYFDWGWDLMPRYLFFLVLALMAILSLLVFQRLRKFVPHSAAQKS